MEEYEVVAKTQEIGPGEKRAVRVGNESLVVLNVGQTYHVLDAECPNDGTDLAEQGRIEGERIVCPNDGWTFDVRTGERVGAAGGGPGLRRHAIRIEANEIKVGPPAAAD